MRTALITIPTLLVLLLAIALIAPSFMDWNQYKGQAREQVSNLTGLDADLAGDISVAILPYPHLSLENVTISNPDFNGEKSFLKLGKLEVSVALFPLLSGHIEVSGIGLDKPVITLQNSVSGTPNWKTAKIDALMSGGKAKPVENAENSSEEEGGAAKSQNIAIKGFSIKGGTFIQKGEGGDFAIADININASADTLTGPFDLEGGVNLAGQDIKFDGDIDAMSEGSDALSSEFTIKIPTANITATYKGIIPVAEPFEAQGAISVQSPNLSKSMQAFNMSENKTLDAPMSLTGVLQGGAEQVKLTEMVFENGLNRATGSLLYTIKDGVLSTQINSDKNMLNAPLRADIRAAMSGGSLILNRGEVALPGNNKISARGKVGAGDDGLNVSISADVNDLAQIAKLVQFDTSSFPKGANSLDLNATFAGSFEVVKFTADVKALGATINANGLASAPLAPEQISGLNVRVQAPNMAGFVKAISPDAALPATFNGPLDFASAIEMKDGATNLSGIKANLAGIGLTGDASYIAREIPKIAGTLKFGNVNIQSSDFKSSNSSVASGVGTQKAAAKSGGKWSAQPMDVSWLRSMDFDLDITASQLTYDDWVLTAPKFDADLAGGILNIKDLSAGLYDGRLSMTSKINASKEGAPMSITAKPVMSKVALGPLVKSFFGDKIFNGNGAIDMNFDINTIGLSQRDLIANLNGNGRLKGEGVSLQNFNLVGFANGLKNIGSLSSALGRDIDGVWGSKASSGEIAFDTVDGAFTINNGVVNIDKLTLDGSHANMTSSGNVNLPAWTLDTLHNVDLKKEDDVPTFTIEFNGSLDKPVRSLGKGVLENYVKKQVSKALQGSVGQKIQDKLGVPLNQFLGGGSASGSSTDQPASNDNTQQQPQNTQPSPEDAIRGVLKGILQ